MSDVRGLPTTDLLAMGRLVLATAQNGLTVGQRYWPLALGVDCPPAPAPPVVYVLTANDAGAIVPVPASAFKFQIDNLDP